MGPINLSLPTPSPPTEFAVVGENRDDPNQLLLLGADGRHYAYSLSAGDTTPVDPDATWSIDQTQAYELFG
jgi:hypothetical protein